MAGDPQDDVSAAPRDEARSTVAVCASIADEASADRHFTTTHLLTGLKSRTISSGIVTSLSQFVQFGLNLVCIMLLARLLAPTDFGLVAMVTAVVGFLRIFNEAGLSTATIQREGITHAQVSNLFWVNFGLGALVTLVLAAASPAIAWFYRESRLVAITLALCLTFVLTSLSVQHLALLKRQMRFKMIAFIQVTSAAAGVLVGVVMAFQGCGYWSLIGMQLATPVVALGMAWSASGWRPQLPKRGSGTRGLLHFGANLTVSSFLWSLARGSDGLLIGRLYGSASLGLYSRAQALLLRPIEQFIVPMESVFVPTLSRLQAQPDRFRRIVLQVHEAVSVVSCLISGLLLALAQPLTLVVLGPKWEGASPIFAGFTLVALYAPMASVAGWLLTSQGRGKEFLVLSSVGAVSAVFAFLSGLPFGPAGVALAYSISCLLIQLPLAYYLAGRRGPVTTQDLWIRFARHLPLWVVVIAATWLARSLVTDSPPLIQLGAGLPVGVLIGGVFILAYPPARRTALNLFQVLRDWKNSRQTAGD
jgi:polysaccharide transporter, PST family